MRPIQESPQVGISPYEPTDRQAVLANLAHAGIVPPPTYGGTELNKYSHTLLVAHMRTVRTAGNLLAVRGIRPMLCDLAVSPKVPGGLGAVVGVTLLKAGINHLRPGGPDRPESFFFLQTGNQPLDGAVLDQLRLHPVADGVLFQGTMPRWGEEM